jgi:uncharacterized membrane protein YkoI
MRELATMVLAMTIAGGLYAPVSQAADDDESEEQLTLAQVPPAVRATIENEAKGGNIAEIERETKGGKVTYEVEIIKDGKELEIEIAADGSVLRREAETDDDDGEDEDRHNRK